MKNFSETNKQEGVLSFLIAFTLINTVSFILLFTSLVFAIGGGINWWQFPFSYALAIFVNYFAANFLAKERKRFYFLKSSMISSVVIIVSIFIAGFFYDTSADGPVYHQETVYQLSRGWNPFYTVLPDSVSQSIWVNHYPKGAEVPQAAIYNLLNKIETGKATNILFLFAGFFICLTAFSKIGSFSYKKRILLSSLLALNPITINQLFTFYIDGQMASLLLCFIAICTLLYNDINKFYLFLLGSVILIIINLKFTGIVFVAVFSIGFLILLLFNKKIQHFQKVSLIIIISGIIGAVFVGYNPFVKNTIINNHPFYPLMGKSKIDIIKESYPIGFADKGRFKKFYISLFAHTDNEGSWVWEKRVPTLKIPFSFNKIDIENARTEDTRVAGFGPFFSGILLVSMLLFIVSILWETNRFLVRKIVYSSAVILISLFLIPEAWWARYVPQFWFIPLFFLIAIEFNQRRWVKISRKILYLLLVGNICFALLSVPYRVLMTMQLEYQLRQLEASGQKIKVNWGNARANRIRFNERQIPYEEQEGVGTKSVEIIGSDSKFELPGTIPDVPMPFLLKWWRGVKPLDK